VNVTEISVVPRYSDAVGAVVLTRSVRKASDSNTVAGIRNVNHAHSEKPFCDVSVTSRDGYIISITRPAFGLAHGHAICRNAQVNHLQATQATRQIGVASRHDDAHNVPTAAPPNAHATHRTPY